MTPELKAKWITALRSGKYKQGKKYLRTKNNKYCCLGVLCEVAKVPATLGHLHYLYDNEIGSLSRKLQEKFGLPSGSMGKLIELNDGCFALDDTKAFPEIANYIEANIN